MKQIMLGEIGISIKLKYLIMVQRPSYFAMD